MLFQDLGARKVVADFSGGFLSSDGGALLLQWVDAGLGISRTLAACFKDERPTSPSTKQPKPKLPPSEKSPATFTEKHLRRRPGSCPDYISNTG